MKVQLCYPFLYEKSNLVEHEIYTDALASYIGLAVSYCTNEELKKELTHVCSLVYHLNGSIRGKLAITLEDITFLQERYNIYYSETIGKNSLFVLPLGNTLASSLHISRCETKKVIRKMFKLKEEGINVENILLDFSNALSDYLFVCALYANKLSGIKETPFNSKSYVKKS